MKKRRCGFDRARWIEARTYARSRQRRQEKAQGEQQRTVQTGRLEPGRCDTDQVYILVGVALTGIHPQVVQADVLHVQSDRRLLAVEAQMQVIVAYAAQQQDKAQQKNQYDAGGMGKAHGGRIADWQIAFPHSMFTGPNHPKNAAHGARR